MKLFYYYTLIEQKLRSQTHQSSSTTWIHLENPSLEEIDHIITRYHLPKDYVTAVLDDAENSRYEGWSHQTLPKLLLIQFPHRIQSPSGSTEFDTYPLSMIFTDEHCLLTVSKFPPTFFDASLVDLAAYFDEQTSIQWQIALPILWQLAHSFNSTLKEIKAKLYQIEKQINVSTENKQLYQMLAIQKSLVLIESATKNNLETLMPLFRSDRFQTSEQLVGHMQDILIETKQSVSSASIHLRLVDQINDTFSAIVSNNLNNVMKILTSLTLVLTIPTIMGGIYGMNVALPFADSKSAFWIIACLTTSLCIAAITFLKKKNLL